MSTNEPFSESELAAATAPAAADPDLDEVEPAAIDEPAAAAETEPQEKLAQRVRRLSPDRIRTVVESLLFVTDHLSHMLAAMHNRRVVAST